MMVVKDPKVKPLFRDPSKCKHPLEARVVVHSAWPSVVCRLCGIHERTVSP